MEQKVFVCDNCQSTFFQPFHRCEQCGATKTNYNLVPEYVCWRCGEKTVTPVISAWPGTGWAPTPTVEVYTCQKCPLPLRETFEDVPPVYNSEAAKQVAATLKAQAKADFVAKQKTDGCFRCGAVAESFVMRGDTRVYTCGGPGCYPPGN